MYLMNVCDNPTVMEVLRIVNIAIKIITIVVPILLLISVSIYLFKTVVNGEIEKIGKGIVVKVVSAILIFFIPTFVSLIAGISGNDGEYKHCVEPITLEQISIAYTEMVEDLVLKAEESFDVSDYYVALSHLYKLKDETKRKEFDERLKTLKEQIDILQKAKKEEASTGYPSETYGKCKFEKRVANGMQYGICVPSEYKTQKIPMIVWLHGFGEVGTDFNTFRHSGLLNVVEKWDSTGLKDIPAIIVAPLVRSGSWSDKRNYEGVRDVMDDVIKRYNINEKNVSLIGHSMGGSGVYYVSANNKKYFTSIVMLSGYVKSPADSNKDYYKEMPMKGYSEGGGAYTLTSSFFKAIGKENQVRKLKCSHGEVPKTALTLDENNDKVSDLIYWMLSSGGGSTSLDDEGTAGTPTVDPGGSTACARYGKYQKCSPSHGVFGSFPYYDSEPDSTSNRWSLEMAPKWKSENFTRVTKTCSNGRTLSWTVHAKAKTTWSNVQDRFCQIMTTGIDGIVINSDDIVFSGPTAVRFVSNSKSISNHSYGLAIDVNPSNKYVVNGKTYQPYGRDINKYNEFVKALGSESDVRNVNYVLWIKIFKPLGFNWGRYWSGSSYDGMHFEINWKAAS